MSDEFPSASGEFAVGAQVAGYRLEEQVGRGGMAVVFRARDDRLDRWVALKILAPQLASDDAFRQRFIRESRAAAAVDHPHIIPVFEAGEADGALFIAMRYVGGGDVRSLLGRLGPLDVVRTAAIVTQVAAALDAAHAAGLVHRDVKPANMLLGMVAGGGHSDHVYLSDFGLSKQALSSTALTSAGQFLGTLDYISPEQIEGRPVDGRSDLYALACAAYEMLSGTPPFKRDQSLALLWAQLSEAAPPLTASRRDLPPSIDQVMARALAKSPGDRYPTCFDFAASLRSACGLDQDAAGRSSAGRSWPATELAAPVRNSGPSVAQDRGTGHPSDRGTGHPSRPPRDRGAGQPGPPLPGRGAGQPWPVTAGATRASSGPGGRPAGYPQPPGSPSYPPVKQPRRSRTALVLAGLAVLVIAGAAVALLVSGVLTARPVASNTPGATTSPARHHRSAGQIKPVAPVGPAATVNAYFAAINSHDYARAWRLGGRNTGSTYSSFVQGYGTTAKDTPTILSVSGNVVTARISAQQTDGTIKTYQGTYTVSNGVITSFDVQQIS